MSGTKNEATVGLGLKNRAFPYWTPCTQLASFLILILKAFKIMQI